MQVVDVNEGPPANTAPTSFTVAINPTVVTESATPTDITVTVGLTGGTFTVARAFQITTVGGGSAERDIDYTRLPLITLTIPANMASASVIIPFTATDDMVAEAGGETVDFQVSFWDILEMNRDSTLTSPPLTVLTINDAPTGDTAPSFGGATVSAQTYTQGTAITPLTLPAATGGNDAITYTLTPALPTGLTFVAATRTITGTASTAVGATMHTYTAADGDDNTDADDSASLMFSITVEANTAPDFGTTTPFVPTGTIAQNRMITPITLPAATGGNGDITYMLAALPTGLTFDGATRVISGTPADIVAEMDYTYTAADADGDTTSTDEDTLIVRFAVIQAPPTSITLSVNPAAVTESSAATTITVTATLVDGSFADARTITFASTGGTATAGTDYTAVSNTPLTIPANMASGTATFSFTANVDEVAEAGGETVLIGRSVTTGTGAVDSEIPVTPATLTINDYTQVTVNAGPDRTVAPGAMFTLNGAVPTSFTNTDATWALSNSDEAIAALVEAGLTMTEAEAEVARLTTALAGMRTLEATLTAPTADPELDGPVPLVFTITVTDNAPPAGQTAMPAMDTVTITVRENTAAVTTALNEMILPEVTRALVNSTTSSITQRIGRAVGGAPQVGSLNFAGQSMGGQDNLAAALRTHGEAMSADSRDIKEMLADSDFVLPLNGGLGIDASMLAFWGSGEYLNFSGDGGGLDWDGDLSGVQLGLDVRLRDDMLVGVALAWLESEVDYKGATAGLGNGAYSVDINSTHPYIGWSSGGLDWWATVGHGAGELEITSQETGMPSQQYKRDIDMQTISVGSSLSFQAGATTLRLKGEVAESQVEVEGGGGIDELQVGASRIRVAMEVGQSRKLDGGRVFEPSVEVAMRYDGGDGETGGGAEIGGGLRYDNPAKRFTVDGRARALLGHGGGYEEWGVSGTVRVASGADGQGASFSVSPGYGNSGSGIQELWRQGLADDDATTTDDYAMKLDARVGYGFGFTLNEHHGILTPYSELTYGTTDSYRMGLNWAAGTRFDLTLLGERREPNTDPAEHAVLLKGEVRF